MRPVRLSRALRRLAIYIDKADKPSLSKVSDRLGKLIKAAEDEEEPEESVEDLVEYHGEIVLEGPFEEDFVNSDHLSMYIEGAITNPEFFKLNPGLEKCVEWDLWVETSWYYSPPEPDVGWGGGAELEEFHVVAIGPHDDYNDRTALSATDSDNLTERYKKEIKSQENDWIDEIEKNRDPF